MAVLPIITAPDPRLKVISDPVAVVDDNVRTLLDDMVDSMYDAVGIGLAAIQVGVAKRIVVIDLADENGKQGNPVYFINPQITWSSDQDRVHEEGCLSLPEHYAEVERPDEVNVSYLDRDGSKQELHATGMLSTCIQHELDHLDGILFVDHISLTRRSMILRKLKKLKRQTEQDA